MKRVPSVIALASLIVTAPAPLAAQDEALPPVRMGETHSNLIVGVRSELTYPRVLSTGAFASRPGYTVGPQIGFPLNKWFAVQTEILFTQYGGFGYFSSPTAFAPGGFGGGSFIGGGAGTFFGQGYPSYGGFSSFGSQQMLLQVPLLARVNVGQIGPVTPVLYAGPMASWMFSCTAGTDPLTGNGVGCGGYQAGVTPISSSYAGMSRWDVGATAGVGLQFNFFDVITIGSDVRYQRGIRAVSPIYPDFRNESISIAFRMGAGPKLWGNDGGYAANDDAGPQGPRPLRESRGGTAGKKMGAGVAPGVRM